MTDHPGVNHVELELVRVSTRGLRRLSRSVEARLPSDRSERVSLFPGWKNPERTGLLDGIIACLEGLGLAADSLFRPGLRSADEVAAGEDARQRYLAEASANGTTWPSHALTLSDVAGRGAVLASDPDGAILYVDFWGPGARAVGDNVFEFVWASVRDAR